nr:MAG TPA: Rotatin, an armadillo repeat protein, centriole functioning [Caudoviricetes sp.]
MLKYRAMIEWLNFEKPVNAKEVHGEINQRTEN